MSPFSTHTSHHVRTKAINISVPDAAVGKESVGDGGHGVLSHSVVEVTAGRIVLLETVRLALRIRKKEEKEKDKDKDKEKDATQH